MGGRQQCVFSKPGDGDDFSDTDAYGKEEAVSLIWWILAIIGLIVVLQAIF